MILEPQDDGHPVPLTEKKTKNPALRKVSTDRFPWQKRTTNNNNSKPRPKEIDIPVQQFKEEDYKIFDEDKFFSENKVKPPVLPPTQEEFTVELRSSLERLSARKSSEKKVERDPTQREHPVNAGAKLEYG